MKYWRVNLECVPDLDRLRVLNAFADSVTVALAQQFPVGAGYEHRVSWIMPPWTGSQDPLMPVWSISRGPFWGIEVRATPQDLAITSLNVSVDAVFPVFAGSLEQVERWQNIPGRVIWSHFAVVLAIPMMALLPFIALYRVAKLALRGDVQVTMRCLGSLRPQLQVLWPIEFDLCSRSLPLMFLSATLATGAVTAGLVWVAGRSGDGIHFMLGLLAFFVGIASIGFLIALIMTLLGLRVEP